MGSGCNGATASTLHSPATAVRAAQPTACSIAAATTLAAATSLAAATAAVAAASSGTTAVKLQHAPSQRRCRGACLVPPGAYSGSKLCDSGRGGLFVCCCTSIEAPHGCRRLQIRMHSDSISGALCMIYECSQQKPQLMARCGHHEGDWRCICAAFARERKRHGYPVFKTCKRLERVIVLCMRSCAPVGRSIAQTDTIRTCCMHKVPNLCQRLLL